MDYADPQKHGIVLYLLSNSLFQDIIKNLIHRLEFQKHAKKSTVEILQIFAAFSKYMNFNTVSTKKEGADYSHHNTTCPQEFRPSYGPAASARACSV